MAFASIHVSNFMVQAVVSAEPELHGRAVALVDGISPLCVVVALNESARLAGIQLGMSESQATEFSGVEIRRRSAARERALHAALLDVGWSVSEGCAGLFLGWMVIIGVRMRVSGWGSGGNTKGVVEKGHCLWRTCGRREMLREWKGFGRSGVEIFCFAWNVFEA